MKKNRAFLALAISIFITSLTQALDLTFLGSLDSDTIQENPEHKKILTQLSHETDPSRFEALTTKYLMLPHQTEKITKRSRNTLLTPEKKLALLQRYHADITQLSQKVTEELNIVTENALNPWNSERKHGICYAVGWSIAALGGLAAEIVVLLGNYTAQEQLAASVPILPATLGFAIKAREHAEKAFYNKHINKKLEEIIKRTNIIQAAEKNLSDSIATLTRDIEQPEDPITILPISAPLTTLANQADSSSSFTYSN